jgi:hypothetical protein
VAPHVDHLTGRRIGSLGKLRGDGLVDRPGDGEGKQGDDQPQERHPDPPYDPSGRTAAHYAKANTYRGLVHVLKAYSPNRVEDAFWEVRMQNFV